jgi:NAD(P)-dependent dehydrogenase (short-subunit alcohol dehydrogenase family)
VRPALAFARGGASVVGCDVNVAAAETTVEMVRAQGGTMISLQPCHLTEPSEAPVVTENSDRSENTGVLALDQEIPPPSRKARSCGQHS